jgi:hypothetical protein
VYLSLHPLTFELQEEALCYSRVMAVAAPTHATNLVMVFQKSLPGHTGLLTPLAGMDEHFIFRPKAPEMHLQCAHNKINVHQ